MRLTNLWPSNSRSNWNLEMLVFEEGGKTGVREEKTLGTGRKPTTILNPHMTPGPEIEHWGTWVEGKRTHHCAIPALLTFIIKKIELCKRKLLLLVLILYPVKIRAFKFAAAILVNGLCFIVVM